MKKNIKKYQKTYNSCQTKISLNLNGDPQPKPDKGFYIILLLFNANSTNRSAIEWV